MQAGIQNGMGRSLSEVSGTLRSLPARREKKTVRWLKAQDPALAQALFLISRSPSTQQLVCSSAPSQVPTTVHRLPLPSDREPHSPPHPKQAWVLNPQESVQTRIRRKDEHTHVHCPEVAPLGEKKKNPCKPG